MTQKDNTTKRRKFQHLTREKRAQIEILLRQKLPKTQIAQAVGISRSTLYCELERGTVEQIDTNLKPYEHTFGMPDNGIRGKPKEQPPTLKTAGLLGIYPTCTGADSGKQAVAGYDLWGSKAEWGI